jgi:hypothetical protein
MKSYLPLFHRGGEKISMPMRNSNYELENDAIVVIGKLSGF